MTREGEAARSIDKRGRAARSIDKGEAAARSIDKRGRRAAEGVGPYGRLTSGGAPLALSKAPEEEGRNGVLWAEL